MKDNYLLDLLVEINSFVHGKLHIPEENHFMTTNERFLLQASIGITDEYYEVLSKADTIKKLGEWGDVFFYMSLAITTLQGRYNVKDFSRIIDKSLEKEPKEANCDFYIHEFLGSCKKIAFQERDDLLPRASIALGMIINKIQRELSKEECELACCLMKYKLTKRYGDQFTAEKSRNRTI